MLSLLPPSGISRIVAVCCPGVQVYKFWRGLHPDMEAFLTRGTGYIAVLVCNKTNLMPFELPKTRSTIHPDFDILQLQNMITISISNTASDVLNNHLRFLDTIPRWKLCRIPLIQPCTDDDLFCSQTLRSHLMGSLAGYTLGTLLRSAASKVPRPKHDSYCCTRFRGEAGSFLQFQHEWPARQNITKLRRPVKML